MNLLPHLWGGDGMREVYIAQLTADLAGHYLQ